MFNTKLFNVPDFIFVGLSALVFAAIVNHFMGDHLNTAAPAPANNGAQSGA